MSRVVEVVLLALLGALCLLGLVVAPTVCFDLLLKVLAATVGLVLLGWCWSWRRPTLRRRVAQLTRAVRAAAGSRVPVLSVYPLGSGSSLSHLFVRVVVASDADRDALQAAGFHDEFRHLVTASLLPVPGHAGISLTIDSQETVDRDWAGNWYAYDK